jgi:hypothetical protein
VRTELSVVIQGLEESLDASITLFDQGGRFILKEENVSGSNLLNLQHLSPGTYFMIIQVGNDSTRWKVVKE